MVITNDEHQLYFRLTKDNTPYIMAKVWSVDFEYFEGNGMCCDDTSSYQ